MSKQRSVEAALMNARRVLTPLPLNISADITLGVRVDDNNTIQLFDIYKIQRDWLEIEAKGNWSLSDGLQIEQKYLQSYVSRRRNFKGLTLSAGIVVRERPEDMDELQYLSSMDHKKLDPMQRKTYQLMKLMEPMFALSFEAISRPTWGAQLSNGSWDGVMALILSGRAEFSLCPMRFVLNRIHLMDYSIAVHTEFVFFIFRHPRRNSIRNIFFEPFADEVWYTTVAVIVLAISLLFLLLRHEHQFLLNKDPHFQYRLDYAILSILEAFFEQGPETNAFTATSTRMLVFTVCVFSLLLQQFYGAFIVGSLLAVAPRSITTLDALYNSSLEIGMENIPYNTESFENTMVPLGMAIYKERICKNREKHILSIEEGAERIKKGGFAFHVSANRMYILLKSLLSEKEFCELQDVPFIAPYRIGMGITKGSPFREYVTTSIIKFRTTSILQHNDNQWQLPRMDCSLSQNREVEVDLQHFLPALLLLCSAMIFSFFILFLELVYYYFESNTKLARLCPRIFPEQRLEFIN
ncbi:glutamate receptor 1 [Ceratitis capitata]|nr:glutamate receptor 1 [Ceratitis capitata]